MTDNYDKKNTNKLKLKNNYKIKLTFDVRPLPRPRRDSGFNSCPSGPYKICNGKWNIARKLLVFECTMGRR